MMLAQQVGVQRPLIDVVESDDVALASRTDVLWYDVLRSFGYGSSGFRVGRLTPDSRGEISLEPAFYGMDAFSRGS